MINPASRQVWVCSCDNTTFKLYEDGAVVCAHCGHETTKDGEWKLPPPPKKDAPKKTIKDYQPMNVVELQNSDIGFKRFIETHGYDIVPSFAVLVTESGRVSTWGKKPEGKAQKDWCKDRMKLGQNMHLGKKLSK